MFCFDGPHVSLLFLHKYPTPSLLFFPFPLLPSLLYNFEISLALSSFFFFFEKKMQFAEEVVQLNQFPFPVYETHDELRSLLELVELVSPNSGSEGSSRAVYSPDEKKQRRKRLNRESARRSRWRKKRHLENLTDEMNRLSLANQRLKNELGLIINQCNALWRENDQLRCESIALSAKFSNLCGILAAMQSN